LNESEELSSKHLLKWGNHGLGTVAFFAFYKPATPGVADCRHLDSAPLLLLGNPKPPSGLAS
jgi:hypothetical protein